jgi:cyclohexyl-isocyanide hydratase
MSPSTITVGFPLYPGCTLLDFAGATQIFAYTTGFEVVWLAADLDPIPTTEGVSVMPNATFDDHQPLSILFVPGGGSDGVGAAMLDPAFQDWLNQTASQAEWVGSVCTGAFILAAAGLLDGCEATTYWSACPVLELFPKVEVVPGYPRWHVDEEKKRFSGGGISSSLDLALRLVEIVGGLDQARLTQLRNQYAPQPPLHSGGPTEASPELVISVTQSQASFTAELIAAVDQVLKNA